MKAIVGCGIASPVATRLGTAQYVVTAQGKFLKTTKAQGVA
jgi:hypothetical protein